MEYNRTGQRPSRIGRLGTVCETLFIFVCVSVLGLSVKCVFLLYVVIKTFEGFLVPDKMK